MAKRKRDVFDTYVDGVIDEDDEIERTKEAAAKVLPSGASLLRKASSPDDLVRLVVEAGVRGSVVRLREQLAMVRDQVKEETRALVGVDPRKLKAVKDVDVAARRTARIVEEKDAETPVETTTGQVT